MTRIAITGATGAMGAVVREVASDRDDIDIGLLVSRSDALETEASVPVVHPASMDSALETNHIDVIVDFTVPSASLTAISAAAQAGVAAVVGTTGFGADEERQLRTTSADIPLLLAPNFSRGIQALVAALSVGLEAVPDYDVEVTETHHHRKRDAPSGTAIRLVEVIEGQRPDTHRVHGREGEAPRSSTDVGIHARRAGTIAGEHEVLLAGNDEEIRLSHRAQSRAVFASGALDAAVWLADQSPGWYGFDEVVAV